MSPTPQSTGLPPRCAFWQPVTCHVRHFRGDPKLKVFLANSFADEEGPLAEEGKTVYVQGSKEKVLELCKFFKSVADHLENSDYCHMHFMDSSSSWNKQSYIDIAVDVEQPNESFKRTPSGAA
jgi:hypothetical protein